MQFGNGATLKFMSGGGSDKSRAGFSTRVVVITETDGMDESGGTSRESDKITQLEARTRAYGSRRRIYRIYMECTVSTEQGRTWQEYLAGTKSRILLPCPHCRSRVTPEREHFVGWQGAESQIEAERTGSFACPSCGEFWNDHERIAANQNGKLLHDGQTIDERGIVQGEPPPTHTLGFRWSAVNNLFSTPGDIAADEWSAARKADEESGEREMRQFVWCIPVAPSKLDQTALRVQELASRVTDLPRGIVPETAKWLTAGVALGKYLTHWIVVAWLPNATGHVVDYGRIEVASGDLGVEQALLVALREFREQVSAGWPAAGISGQVKVPNQVWIDSGYIPESVYAFCRESGERFRPAIGRGAGQQRAQWYNRPTSSGSVVRYIGEGFHFNWVPAEGLYLAEVDADHWKTWVHQRLSTPVGNVGAMALFHASSQEHLALAKHLTAETKTEEFIAGRGVVVKWERLRRQNHWFDALYNACTAAHFCGVRLVDEVKPEPIRRPTAEELRDQAEHGPGWRPRMQLRRRW